VAVVRICVVHVFRFVPVGGELMIPLASRALAWCD
jgi:hypothetical protein